MNWKRCLLALDRTITKTMGDSSTARTTGTSAHATNQPLLAISTTTIIGSNSKVGDHNNNSHLGKEAT